MNDSAELERRICNLIQVGVVSEVQPEKGLCRVSFGERVSPLSPWLASRAGKDKVFWHPDIGEQAVFISPYGDGSEGFVLLGVFSGKIPLPAGVAEGIHIVEYADGARMEYNRNEHVFSFTDSFGSAIKMAEGYIDLLPAIKVRVKKGGN
jgi:phage baseplate assembly protein V